jgi:hypothetical protein
MPYRATSRRAEIVIAFGHWTGTMIKLAASLSLIFWLAACSANIAQNERCAREAPANARYPWGYYAGYGCGPITPSVTAPFG